MAENDRPRSPSARAAWLPGVLILAAATLAGMRLRGPAGGVPPSASAGAAQVVTDITTMRRLCRDSMILLDRYDRSCQPAADPSVRESETIQRGLIGDDFTRVDRGDMGILFTALGRLLEAIRHGDEAGIESPIWLHVDRVAFSVLSEAAASNGFMRESVLRSSLERIEQQIAGGASTRFRSVLRRSMAPYLAHLQSMGTGSRRRIMEGIRELQKELEGLPEVFARDPMVQLHRLELHARLDYCYWIEDKVLGEYRVGIKGEGAVQRRENARRAFDVFTAPGFFAGGAGDEELQRTMQWYRFHLLAAGLDGLPTGSVELPVALDLLDRFTAGSRPGALPPTVLRSLCLSLSELLAALERRPVLAVKPETRSRWTAIIADHAPAQHKEMVNLLRTPRPPAEDP